MQPALGVEAQEVVPIQPCAEKLVLGRDLAAGQRPVVAVPGGCWKAHKLHEGASYALMANALSPEWTPDRVRIGGAGENWLRRFAGAAPWATQEDLREMIGPNWKAQGDAPWYRDFVIS